MQTRLALTFLVTIVAALPLAARDRQPGDYAPRNSLLYARLENLGGAAAKVAGDDFEAPVRQILGAVIQEHWDRGGAPLGAELLSLLRHARQTEIAVADVMVRAPHVQLIAVIDLAAGAPREFSKEFLDIVKAAQSGPMKDVKITATSMESEMFCLRLFEGMLAITTTPALMKHVADVREGNTEESLSDTKRFQGWAKTAKGELVMFADLKALRSALDRLGREATKQVLEVLEEAEYTKWDYLSITGEIPSRASTQINLNAQLVLAEPWGGVKFAMRPPGGFSLHKRLPREVMMLLLAQLGGDHKKTLYDTLGFFHEQEIGRLAVQAGREVERCRARIDAIDKSLGELKEDAAAERKQLEDEKKSTQAQLEAAQKRVEEGKARPFEPSKESRLAAGITNISGSERFLDGMVEGLKAMEIDLDDLLGLFGSECAVGNVGLPGASLSGYEMNQTLFFAIQTRGDVAPIKQKMTAFLRKMEEQGKSPDRLRRQWWVVRSVPGGEIIVQRGGWASQCFFIGDGLVGACGCEDIALRVLAASAGNNAIATGRVPGADGTASKVFYLDLMEIINSTMGARAMGHGILSPPPMKDRLAKLMRAGLRLSLATDEQPAGLTVHANIAGDFSLRQVLDAAAEEAEFQRARSHDEKSLVKLREACEAWLQAQRPALLKLKEEDLKKAIAAVTPKSLSTDGHLKAFDGLRSAFDPLMKERFKEMLKARSLELGGKPEDPLSESGFLWFGLPVDIATQDIEQPDGPGKDRPVRDGKYKQIERYSGDFPSYEQNLWMVCAQYGSWTRGGRMALIHLGGSYHVAYLSDAQFNAIREANAQGKRLAELPQPAATPGPEWRERINLNQNLYSICNIGDRILRMKREGQIASYSEVAFRGSDLGDEADKALSTLLKQDDDRERDFYGIRARSVEIITGDDGFKVRLYGAGGLWVEVGSDNSLKCSWDE